MKFFCQYIPGTEEYALGFSELDQPIMFRSRAEAFAFCIDYSQGDEFDFIDVDDSNWQELCDSGAFDG